MWDFLGPVIPNVEVCVSVCASVLVCICFIYFFGSVSVCVNLNIWTSQYYRAIFFCCFRVSNVKKVYKAVM